MSVFEKAWSTILQQEVEDDSMPSWDDETPKMDALRGDREIDTKFYGVTTEIQREGNTVEESRGYDTWEEAEGWVIHTLMIYNPGMNVKSGEMERHPFTGMRYKDYWSEYDEVYIGTVWEREV